METRSTPSQAAVQESNSAARMSWPGSYSLEHFSKNLEPPRSGTRSSAVTVGYGRRRDLVWDMPNEDLYKVLFSPIKGAAFCVVRRFAGTTVGDGSEEEQHAWVTLWALESPISMVKDVMYGPTFSTRARQNGLRAAGSPCLPWNATAVASSDTTANVPVTFRNLLAPRRAPVKRPEATAWKAESATAK